MRSCSQLLSIVEGSKVKAVLSLWNKKKVHQFSQKRNMDVCTVDRIKRKGLDYINKINVNVHVYSPDIPVGSADCTIYTPGIGTHSFTVSSPLGRIQHLRTLLQL